MDKYIVIVTRYGPEARGDYANAKGVHVLEETEGGRFPYRNQVIGLFAEKKYMDYLNKFVNILGEEVIPLGRLRDYIVAQVWPLEWKSNDEYGWEHTEVYQVA